MGQQGQQGQQDPEASSPTAPAGTGAPPGGPAPQQPPGQADPRRPTQVPPSAGDAPPAGLRGRDDTGPQEPGAPGTPGPSASGAGGPSGQQPGDRQDPPGSGSIGGIGGQPDLPASGRWGEPSAWQRTPLWLRLVALLLIVTLVALLLTGFVGVRLLRGHLVDRVDERLQLALTPLRNDVTTLEELAENQLPNELAFVLQNAEGRTVQKQYRPLQDRAEPDLPALTLQDVADRGGQPFTVPATEGDESWRVLARPVFAPRLGGEATVLVTTSLDDVDAAVDRLIRIDLIVGALVLGGLAVAGYLLVRATLRPLTAIEQTAGAIARGDLTRRVAHDDPGTEVGRLGGALNVMLNQIENAFRARATSEARARRSEEQMRQFVADASHELRTPLTSIRGFAELHRQGAVTDAQQTSDLLRRIEDEATRMGLLVEDLLLLARLDQQRPLEQRPVDLVVVAADVVETARARAAGRDLRFSGEPGVVVAGDEARLRQVATNLVDNALTHTPEGTPIAVRVARTRRDDRDVAVLEVSDWGPGLSQDQVQRVFERFYRTDAARSRAQGGTGLGLSIVAAITKAHGGGVEVEATGAPPPDGGRHGPGATFRLLFPLPAPPPSGAKPA